MPFSIDLYMVDIDYFLQEKITKKLAFWSTVHISLVGQIAIINSLFLSGILLVYEMALSKSYVRLEVTSKISFGRDIPTNEGLEYVGPIGVLPSEEVASTS